MITQSELKELLSYNPETGAFTWKINQGRVRIGDPAGWITEYGYIRISIDTNRYYVHRLVWLFVHGEFPADQIDHINGNGLDNRILNLRSVTCSENHKNQKIPKNNASGVMGVSWNNSSSKWHAKIKVDRKDLWLGAFDDWFEAVCARKSADNKYGFHSNHGRR